MAEPSKPTGPLEAAIKEFELLRDRTTTHDLVALTLLAFLEGVE